MLRDRLEDLPDWLRLVVSSRRDPAILDLLSSARVHEIAVNRTENLQDVAQYLETKFREPGLLAPIHFRQMFERDVEEEVAEQRALQRGPAGVRAGAGHAAADA